MNTRIEAKIREVHKSLAGLSPSESEQIFLKLVSKFDTYGVEPVFVQDRKGDGFYAGLSHEGVCTFSDSRKVHVFAWNKIQKISYDGKLFIIQVEWEHKKHMLGFKCQTSQAAEALWKWAVDRQCFFTLSRSVDAKESKSSGGLFKKRQFHMFSGRCQKELMQQLTSQGPQIPTTEIKRSHSLLNIARKINTVRASNSQENLLKRRASADTHNVPLPSNAHNQNNFVFQDDERIDPRNGDNHNVLQKQFKTAHNKSDGSIPFSLYEHDQEPVPSSMRRDFEISNLIGDVTREGQSQIQPAVDQPEADETSANDSRSRLNEFSSKNSRSHQSTTPTSSTTTSYRNYTWEENSQRMSHAPAEKKDSSHPPAELNFDSTDKTTERLNTASSHRSSGTLATVSAPSVTSSYSPDRQKSSKGYNPLELNGLENSTRLEDIHHFPHVPFQHEQKVNGSKVTHSMKLENSEHPPIPLISPSIMTPQLPEAVLSRNTTSCDQSYVMNYGYSLYPKSSSTVFRHSPESTVNTQQNQQKPHIFTSRYLHFTSPLNPNKTNNDAVKYLSKQVSFTRNLDSLQESQESLDTGKIFAYPSQSFNSRLYSPWDTQKSMPPQSTNFVRTKSSSSQNVFYPSLPRADLSDFNDLQLRHNPRSFHNSASGMKFAPSDENFHADQPSPFVDPLDQAQQFGIKIPELRSQPDSIGVLSKEKLITDQRLQMSPVILSSSHESAEEPWVQNEATSQTPTTDSTAPNPPPTSTTSPNPPPTSDNSIKIKLSDKEVNGRKQFKPVLKKQTIVTVNDPQAKPKSESNHFSQHLVLDCEIESNTLTNTPEKEGLVACIQTTGNSDSNEPEQQDQCLIIALRQLCFYLMVFIALHNVLNVFGIGFGIGRLDLNSVKTLHRNSRSSMQVFVAWLL
ncbi:hypothetical protein Ciccas_002287, partial [Cichlidogyrus casuarinus]